MPCDAAEHQRMRRIHMAWAAIDAGQPQRIDALCDALPALRRWPAPIQKSGWQMRAAYWLTRTD